MSKTNICILVCINKKVKDDFFLFVGYIKIFQFGHTNILLLKTRTKISTQSAREYQLTEIINMYLIINTVFTYMMFPIRLFSILQPQSGAQIYLLSTPSIRDDEFKLNLSHNTLCTLRRATGT